MPMYSDGSWGPWLLMSIVMVVFLGAVVWAVVFMAKGSSDRRDRQSRDGALDVLEERFARGEIDEQEFRARRSALTGRPATG